MKMGMIQIQRVKKKGYIGLLCVHFQFIKMYICSNCNCKLYNKMLYLYYQKVYNIL